MNKHTFAMMASALFAAGGNIDNFYSVKFKPQPMPPTKTRPLREYTWKGHTIMAYSKDDARNRIKAQLMKGE